MVRVTNLETDESIVVRINDRMKPKNDNIINLSGATARQLGLFESNATEISITILEGGDITNLMEDVAYAEDTVIDAVQSPTKTTFSSMSEMPSVNLPGAIRHLLYWNRFSGNCRGLHTSDWFLFIAERRRNPCCTIPGSVDQHGRSSGNGIVSGVFQPI